METGPITAKLLARSVMAVPPLARDADLNIHREENCKIIRHIEAGGVNNFLYGGNAVLGHVSIAEYRGLLEFLVESVSETSLVIPSIGPGFGMMMDQAKILREFPFPTVMILPTNDPTTPQGLATAVRLVSQVISRPVVLYLKRDGVIDVGTLKRLVDDRLIAYVKYAIPRTVTSDDPFLRSLVDAIGGNLIVSGMGEQPAITHMREFGVVGFTSGIVCLRPDLSLQLLRAVQSGDFTLAEQIREQFRPLESLRDRISPVRVLHAAVALAGIGHTGPITPLLSSVSESDAAAISEEIRRLAA